MGPGREGGPASFAPYEPPRAERSARPAVIVWFRIYAGTMALAAVALGGFATLQAFSSGRPEAVAVLLLAAALLVLYGLAAVVPRKPWGWSFGLLAIGLGLAGGTAIFALPLLVHWLRPQVRAAFRRL